LATQWKLYTQIWKFYSFYSCFRWLKTFKIICSLNFIFCETSPIIKTPRNRLRSHMGSSSNMARRVYHTFQSPHKPVSTLACHTFLLLEDVFTKWLQFQSTSKRWLYIYILKYKINVSTSACKYMLIIYQYGKI